MAEDYRAVVARLKKKEMTVEDLAYRARQHAEATGAPRGTVSLSLIQKRLAPGSTARPSPQLLEALAHALEVAPDEFTEYRLAQARRLFDEQLLDGGLDEALANLRLFDAALELASEAAMANAAEPGERQIPRSVTELREGRAKGRGQ